MSLYTTGELAKICGISVRTVQFYDTKDLLKPSQLSEGGRRLYTEEDAARLRLICVLKSLGLTLSCIREILKSPNRESRAVSIRRSALFRVSAGHLHLLKKQRVHIFLMWMEMNILTTFVRGDRESWAMRIRQ